MSCRLESLTPKMNMSRRKLEITILSCEGLTINGKPVKNTFVLVITDPVNTRLTSVDLDGGSHPSWNEKLSLEIPMHERVITLEVHCKARGGAVRVVGSARMPVSDFMGGYLPDNYLNFLSYRLRDGKGERNGIVNVSVRVKPLDYNLANGGKDRGGYVREQTLASSSSSSSSSSNSNSSPVMAVPVATGKNFDGVVTGIPVNWYTNNHEHYSRF